MPQNAATKPRASRIASLLAIGTLAAAASFGQDSKPAESAAGAGAPKQDAAQAPAAQPAAPKPMDPEEARRRVLTLFEGALSDTDNDQDFVQSQGYFKLLQILSAYKPEDVSARAKPLDYEAAMRDPNAWRGEFVRVRGILAKGPEGEKLAEPVNGQPNVFRGIITDANATDAVFFDILGPVDVSHFGHMDLVDIEGVFYRTLHYENVNGQQRAVPYVIARTLTRPDPATLKRETHPLLIILLGGTAVLVAGLVAWNVIQGKRRGGPTGGDPSEVIRRARERAAAKHSKT